MSPSSHNKYGSRSGISDQRRKQIQEKIKKQKEAEIKAAIMLAIISVFIQGVTIVFYFNKTLFPYVLLPAIFGLLISGMAIGLIHTDKAKKFIVSLIFMINLAIAGYISYVFFMIEKEQQEEEIENSKADTLIVQNNTNQINFNDYGRKQ